MRKFLDKIIVLAISILMFRSVTPSQAEEIQADRSIFTDTMVEMSWVAVQQEAKQGAIVLFPIAVVEEHGPHMDLSPDIYLTSLECRLIKQDLEEQGIRTIIAPPYYWGINMSTGMFPGSFTVRPETFKAILFDTIKCLKTWGFTKIFCVNLHGDPHHRSGLKSSITAIRDELDIDVYDVSTLQVNIPPPSFPPSRSGKFSPDYHAGVNETALIWAYYPEKVDVEIAKALKPQSSFAPLGYVGDPANFHLEEHAAKTFQVFAKHEAEKIAAFLKQLEK